MGHSINITPLSPFHLAPSTERGLLAGFGRLPEHKIRPAADALSTLVIQAEAVGRPG